MFDLLLDRVSALLERFPDRTRVGFSALGRDLVTHDLVLVVRVVLWLCGIWFFTDFGVGLLVHFLHAISVDTGLDVSAELTLKLRLILLFQVLHVLRNVLPKNLVLVRFLVVLGLGTLLLRRFVTQTNTHVHITSTIRPHHVHVHIYRILS